MQDTKNRTVDFSMPGTTGLVLEEPLIVELGASGRMGYSIGKCDVDLPDLEKTLGKKLLRSELEHFPEVSEAELMRHYVRMSQWNYGVDSGIFPLGSCTMKYNPKINEETSRLPGFQLSHPLFPDDLIQGSLNLIYELEEMLSEIAGMDATTLQPAAGAHGELTGLMMIRAYHLDNGDTRKTILVPDSAHGTNPASGALCGYKAVQIKSGPEGYLHPDAVREAMTEDVAALMITNPNTLGIFEKHIAEICEIVHEKGGLIYNDGANMNALMGVARPGDMGFDVIQYNLHKTFSTPHGGGGPGSGPVSIKEKLIPYLPYPVIEKENESFALKHDLPKSIGKIKGFYGNFGVMVRAYTYILELGRDNIRRVSELAVLNANYIRARLKDRYYLPYQTDSMHEVVFTDKHQDSHGVNTMDIAKRLLDMGYHAPTIYFPLVVHAALMIEPTETESKQSCDNFIQAMIKIADEAIENPQQFSDYPKKTFRGKLDEVTAARKPVLRWKPEL